MKKSMIALAVLAAAAGTAQAASSVTLYGRMDIGYSRSTGESGATQIVQGAATEGETRLGLKGQEDLGGGYAGIFQLEGRFDGSTGNKDSARTFFDRESTVGLKTPFGSIRMGTSLASMERAIGFTNIGRRSLDLSPYASSARVSNAAFYDFNSGAIALGAHLTTRSNGAIGQATPTNTKEGSVGPQYGAYAKYSANGLTAGLGYQKDGGGAAINKEFGIGLGYTFNPVFVNAAYTSQTRDNQAIDKVTMISANIGTKLGANDTVAYVFQRNNLTYTTAGVPDGEQTINGLEYVHALSKRTSVYANIARVTKAEATNNTWNLAVRHNF